MAERLSGFCEAILNIEGLCKSELRCCVAKQLFNGKFPPELIEPASTTSGAASSLIEGAQALPLALAQAPVAVTTTARTPSGPPRSETSSTPPDCKGTCVTGFFALLCDEIDRQADCGGNGRCCITKKVSGNRNPAKATVPAPAAAAATPQKCPGVCIPQVMASFCDSPSVVLPDTTCQQGTLCCLSQKDGQDAADSPANPPPQRQAAAQPTPPRKQAAPQVPSGGGGGGTDFADLILGVAPQLLSAATGNSGAGSAAAALLPVLAPALGSILGGGGSSGRPAAPNRDPAGDVSGSGSAGAGPGLASVLLPALGSIFAGGPSRPQSRPRPTPPPVPTTTTTTTTTTEKADDRPECPGTCIGSYLSFTCFGKRSSNQRSCKYIHVWCSST